MQRKSSAAQPASTSSTLGHTDALADWVADAIDLEQNHMLIIGGIAADLFHNFRCGFTCKSASIVDVIAIRRLCESSIDLTSAMHMHQTTSRQPGSPRGHAHSVCVILRIRDKVCFDIRRTPAIASLRHRQALHAAMFMAIHRLHELLH